MIKKVVFTEKNHRSQNADQWVELRKTAPQDQPRMKRLTLDISEHLHGRIKAACAQRGVKMADEIRALLEQAFKPCP